MDLGVVQKGCSHYRAHQDEGAVLKLRAQALGTEDPQFSERGFGSEACAATNTPETWSKYLSSKEPSSMLSFLLLTGIFMSDLQAEVMAKQLHQGHRQAQLSPEAKFPSAFPTSSPLSPCDPDP